jgi:Protein of unknown function (DUF3606)
MADDLDKRGGRERSRSNLDHEYELRDWVDKLSVLQEQLKEAIRTVGDRADRAQDHPLARTRKASSTRQHPR